MRILAVLLLFVALVASYDDELLTQLSQELKKMLASELALPVQRRISDDLLQLVEASGEPEGEDNTAPQFETTSPLKEIEEASTQLTSTTTESSTTLEIETTTAAQTTTSMETTTSATTTSAPPLTEASTESSSTTTQRTSVAPHPKVCVAEVDCLGDYDCGKGRCSGTHLGKCNCRACVPARTCANDTDCGGLRGGCHLGQCHCERALSIHGFPLMVDALLSFCGIKKCSVTADDCHGLPCNVGKCICTGIN